MAVFILVSTVFQVLLAVVVFILYRDLINLRFNVELTKSSKALKEKGYLVPSYGRLTIRNKIKPKVNDDIAAWEHEQRDQKS